MLEAAAVYDISCSLVARIVIQWKKGLQRERGTPSKLHRVGVFPVFTASLDQENMCESEEFIYSWIYPKVRMVWGRGVGIERKKPPYSLDFGDVSCYLVATFKVKSAERGINSSLKCSPIKPRLVRIMERNSVSAECITQSRWRNPRSLVLSGKCRENVRGKQRTIFCSLVVLLLYFRGCKTTLQWAPIWGPNWNRLGLIISMGLWHPNLPQEPWMHTLIGWCRTYSTTLRCGNRWHCS